MQALTRLQTIDIDRSALQALAIKRPQLGMALWIDALVDGSIFREWVTNVGRRDGRTRIAHLLCEFAVRLKSVGLGDGRSCELPMTQEQIGDATGMTGVHVNRVLKELSAEDVIKRNKKYISFADWERVRSIGDFSAHYLHLDQTATSNRPSQDAVLPIPIEPVPHI